MPENWSGQFSFLRRTHVRWFCCPTICAVVIGFLLQPICRAQSSDQDLARRESLYQRWLPSPDSSSPDPRKLLEKIRKQKLLPTDSPEVRLPSPGSIPRDGNGLPKELPNLTPQQLQQLRQIAEQYIKEGNAPFKPEDLERIPPKLLEQIKKSPELQQLAKELAEKSLSNEENASQESGRAQDPFAPLPIPNTNSTLGNEKQTDATNTSRDLNKTSQSGLPSAPASGNMLPSDGKAAASKPSDVTQAKQPNSNDARPPNSIGGNSNANPTTRPSPSGLPGQSNLGPPNFAPQSANRSPSSSTRTPPDQPQFRRRMSENEARPSQRKESSSNSSSNSPIQRSSERGSSSTPPRAMPETAVEKIQRKFRELGFGSVLEKIAKEATGLEQGETTNRKSQAKEASKANSVSKPNATTASDSRSANDVMAPTPTTKKSSAQQDDPTRRNENRSSMQPRPTPPTQPVSNSNEPSSPFELPKLEFPKFSMWWIVAVLSLFMLGVAWWFLSKSPVVVAKVFGNRQLKQENAILASWYIGNRSDAIEVFHRLIETKFRSFEHWWTSRRALQQVDKSLPSLIPSMRDATEIYEMARYLPSDQELSEPDLERMRKAIETCAMTSVLQ